MNPLKFLRLISDYAKAKSIMNEKGTPMKKAMQLTALVIQVISTLGLATFAQNWTGSHLDAIIVINLLLTVGHALLPSVIPAPISKTPKQLGLFLLLLFVPLSARAQKPVVLSNIYAAGVSFNQSATPQIAGTGLYARIVDASTSTYAFTAIDALPASIKPFTVSTNIGAGIAQKVLTIGKAQVFIPTSAGISFNGSNTGWQWNGGALISIPLKGQFRIMPVARFLKSSVSAGSSYQPIIGVLFGWGS